MYQPLELPQTPDGATHGRHAPWLTVEGRCACFSVSHRRPSAHSAFQACQCYTIRSLLVHVQPHLKPGNRCPCQANKRSCCYHKFVTPFRTSIMTSAVPSAGSALAGHQADSKLQFC